MDGERPEIHNNFRQALMNQFQGLSILIGANHLLEMDKATLFSLALILFLCCSLCSWIQHGDPDPVHVDTIIKYGFPILQYLFLGSVIHSVLDSSYKWVLIAVLPLIMMLTNPCHRHLLMGIKTLVNAMSKKFREKWTDSTAQDSSVKQSSAETEGSHKVTVKELV